MSSRDGHYTGEGLIALGGSRSLKEFDGIILTHDNARIKDELLPVNVSRRNWSPRRVVAIDGSNIIHRVKNGFPGAEAGLLQLSVVFIDISKLRAIRSNTIPSPLVFNEMDKASTLDAVLPGANIARKNVIGDSPTTFFRDSVFETFKGSIAGHHETILETFRAISAGHKVNIECPISDCDRRINEHCQDKVKCKCENGFELYETDILRFHERFSETGSNGEVHGEVRLTLEVLTLVNILRYFAEDSRVQYLADCAFILNGPLAVFGQPAWIAPYVKKEIKRISTFVRERTGGELLLFGIEKSGQFMNHFDAIDYTEKAGPRSYYAPQTLLIPDAKYINRNIVYRPEDAKPHGIDTYYGRKVMYKTRSGEHNVLTIAITNDAADDFHQTNVASFPRIGDALNIMDQLSTYLYEDGFMPLIRANAHAAIPLRQGAEILEELFKNG